MSLTEDSSAGNTGDAGGPGRRISRTTGRSYLVVPVEAPGAGREGGPTAASLPGGPDTWHVTRSTSLRILPGVPPTQREYVVLLSGDILTRDVFRRAHREQGAWIFTAEPDRVRRALGLGPDESGIETEWH